MRFFRRVVFDHFDLKLLALAISFALWSVYAAQPLVEAGYEAPVAFVNVPRDLAISSDVPATVRLRIRGRAALVRRVRPSDVTFTVDLGRAREGDILVRLTPQMATVPYGMAVVGIAPAEFRVSLVASSTPQPDLGE